MTRTRPHVIPAVPQTRAGALSQQSNAKEPKSTHDRNHSP